MSHPPCTTSLMQGMFLRAGRQDVALQMRQDLRQWGAALRLAERCAPEQAVHIKKHHAEALEIQGDVGGALQYFQVRNAGSAREQQASTGCHCTLLKQGVAMHAVYMLPSSTQRLHAEEHFVDHFAGRNLELRLARVGDQLQR